MPVFVSALYSRVSALQNSVESKRAPVMILLSDVKGTLWTWSPCPARTSAGLESSVRSLIYNSVYFSILFLVQNKVKIMFLRPIGIYVGCLVSPRPFFSLFHPAPQKKIKIEIYHTHNGIQLYTLKISGTYLNFTADNHKCLVVDQTCMCHLCRIRL